MPNLKKHIRMAMALGVLSLVAVVLSHLALTDIAHGESDVAWEWRILRVSALVLLMFIGMSVVTFGRVLKSLPQGG